MQSPILVLVPGLLCDKTVWQPVIDKFEDRWPIVVGDCSTQDSITQMSADILDSADGDLYVAGHSMGARVALEMARMQPERVKKLVLADTGTHPRKPGEDIKRQEMVALAFGQGMRALAEKWLPPMVHPDRQADNDLMTRLTDMVLRMSAPLHARQINALLHRPDATLYLPDIACETLLIVGRQDAWSPVAQHEAMLPALQTARLKVIEDAGHFAPIEQPEEFVATIGEWLGEAD